MRKRVRVKGSILIAVLIISLVLMIIGSSMMLLGQKGQLAAVMTNCQLQARCAADAGLAKAIYELKLWDGISNLPIEANVSLFNNSGLYSYHISKESDDSFIVCSTGQSGLSFETINCKMSMGDSIPIWEGVNLNGMLTLTEDSKIVSLIDGYELILNTNTSGETEVKVRKGSVIDGSIVISSETDINNDVFISNDSSVTGGVMVVQELERFPEVVAPVGLTNRGSLRISRVIQNNIEFDQVLLKGQTEVRIRGDVVLSITGTTQICDGSRIFVEAGSSLKLYVNDNVLIKGAPGVVAESIDDIKNIEIYGTDNCLGFIIRSSGVPMDGCIYAPKAKGIMKNSYLRGVFSSKSLALRDNSILYYDIRTKDACDYGPESMKIQRWWE